MNLKKNKIFILDQDQNSAPKLVEVLKGAGFVVKWFVLRSKLLSALDVELPDLFIVDPHYDGEEGIRFLATRQSDLILKKIPVIALSSKVSRHDITQMLSMGVKDYQLKPINSRLVLTLLKRILHKDHLKRYEVDSSDVAVAEVSITFTKISETSLVAESPVKLTDDEDGHYRIKSDDLETRGVLDECLSLSKNTTFASGDGLFRAYFRMCGLKEAVLQKIRSGRF